MRTLTRLLVIVFLAHSAAFVAPAVAQDNTAVAVNKKDGKSVFKLAFSVKKASGDVDATNTAVAYSSCTDCKTVAAAIQVVLVSDPGDSVTPQNLSLAINYQCDECETLAAAYQFVFGDGQELEFTEEGKQRLHDLKKRFHDLKQRDDLTLDEIAAEIAAVAAEVAVVVDTEVQVKKASDTATASTTILSPDTTAAPASTTTVPTTTEAEPESTTTTPVADTSTTISPTTVVP